MTDLSTLLAELDAKVAKMPSGTWEVYSAHFIRAVNRLDSGEVIETSIGDARFREQAQGIVALVNAYPQLREGIEQLRQQLETSRMSEVEQAKRRGELGLEVVKLRALVEQQREALVTIVNECTKGVGEITWPPGVALIAKARAVLAQEVPGLVENEVSA